MAQIDDEELNDFLATIDLGPTVTVTKPEPSKALSPEPSKTPDPATTSVQSKTQDAELDDFLATVDIPQPTAPVVVSTAPSLEDDGDDVLDFMNNSGLKREREVPALEKPWMKYHKFTRVETIEQVNQLVDATIASGFASLDLETEGLNNRIIYVDGKPETVHKIVGYVICHDGYEGFYIPVGHQPTDGGPSLNVEPRAEVEAAITRLCRATIPEGTPEAKAKDPLSWDCERPKLVLAFWNAQFDHEFLYPVTGIDWWHPSSFEDGMLASFVKYAGDKGIGLKPKAKQLLKDQEGNPYEMIELKELFQKGMPINFSKLAPDEIGVLRYAGSDSISTYKLCQLPDLVPLVHEKWEFTYRLEKQTTCTMRVAERNRVKANRELVEALLKEKTKERETLLTKIKAFARTKDVDLEPGSPKQLGEFLFGDDAHGMNLSPKPEKNEASGQYKTDSETLEALAELPNAPPILKEVVEFRGLDKMIGTYLESFAANLDENDELRFSFKQTGASTGRFSAPAGNADHGYSGIPIHGIPAGSDLRRAFIARPGYTLAKCDYAGEELRIAANVSGEPIWIKEFLEGDGDLHTITAKAFFGKQNVSKDERKAGKIANFALLYGGGPKSIVRATGCDDLEARRRKQAFDKAVPTFATWIKKQHQAVKKNLGVRTAFERWLPIPDALSPDKAIQAACERHAVNFQIQGAGADIMKIALVLVHKKLHGLGWLRNGGDDSVRILLTVHDEIVFEIRHDRVAEAIPLIVDIMESPWRIAKWKVPLIVEPLVGFNWSSGYKVERVKEGHNLGTTEVMLNGFIYSTTREAANEQEKADTNEIQAGKKLFQVIDPPWLIGYSASTEPVITEAVKETEVEPIQVEAIQPQSEPIVPLAASTTVADPSSPSFVDDLLASISLPAEVSKENSSTKIVLSINHLNDRTVAQLLDFVAGATPPGVDPHGHILHLTDIVGETIIDPALEVRVYPEVLKALLRRHNLWD
jgi:DNA polymerase I-like protein with 3'-5' exonuclease and polymerase domains